MLSHLWSVLKGNILLYGVGLNCVCSTLYTLTFADREFLRFSRFMFAVCDITAEVLPVWTKFLWDETFADGY